MLMNEALDVRLELTDKFLTSDQFESPLKNEFKCSICWDVVDPDFFDCTECANLFCTGCVRKDRAVRNKEGKCPVCRAEQFKCGNRIVRNEFLGKRLRCSTCSVSMTVDMYKDHGPKCRLKHLRCPLKCGFFCSSSDMYRLNDHWKKECPRVQPASRFAPQATVIMLVNEQCAYDNIAYGTDSEPVGLLIQSKGIGYNVCDEQPLCSNSDDFTEVAKSKAKQEKEYQSWRS